jgi:MFS family permease
MANVVQHVRAVVALNTAQTHTPPGAHDPPLFTPDFLFATVANLFNSLGQQMLLATLPVYVIALGGSRTDAGLVTAAAATTALLVRPFVGYLTDAWRRRPVVLIGCGGYLLSSITYLMATSVPFIGLGRVVNGFALSNYTTAANTYIADIAPPRRRAEAIGFFAATQDLGLITGPAVGFFIVGLLGFHNLFFVSLGMASLALLCSLFARERRAQPTGSRPQWSIRTGIVSSRALPMASIAFCLGLGFGPVNTFVSIFGQSRGIANPGLFFTVQALALLLSRTLAGRLADRRGRGVVMLPGLLAGALGLAVLPLATSLPVFFISAALWGAGFGFAQPASMALLVDRVRSNERGLALSTYFMGFDVGIGLGSAGFGVLSQAFGWEIMWPLAGACVGLGWLGLLASKIQAEVR